MTGLGSGAVATVSVISCYNRSKLLHGISKVKATAKGMTLR